MAKENSTPFLLHQKKKALGYFRRTQIPDSDHTVTVILNYRFFSKHSHYFFFLVGDFFKRYPTDTGEQHKRKENCPRPT